MKPYLITYTTDKGSTFNSMRVEAPDYTKAYLGAYYKLPGIAEITEVNEVTQ